MHGLKLSVLCLDCCGSKWCSPNLTFWCSRISQLLVERTPFCALTVALLSSEHSAILIVAGVRSVLLILCPAEMLYWWPRRCPFCLEWHRVPRSHFSVLVVALLNNARANLCTPAPKIQLTSGWQFVNLRIKILMILILISFFYYCFSSSAFLLFSLEKIKEAKITPKRRNPNVMAWFWPLWPFSRENKRNEEEGKRRRRRRETKEMRRWWWWRKNNRNVVAVVV